MNFLIVTGLSGAGKSTAANALEDIGFYVIDNIPPQLIPKFADICMQSSGQMNNVAVVTDIRGSAADDRSDIFSELHGGLEYLKNSGLEVRILFLDAPDSVLINRYKETRRVHPLEKSRGLTLTSALAEERAMLARLRESADYYVDTSGLSLAKLRDRISDMFIEDPSEKMRVKVVSFGFKYGACLDADLVFDVRCLPNPFYIEELKRLTGLDAPVRDYVMSFPQSVELENKLRDLLDFLIPLYRNEGKSSLVVAFGCTGGKHRSITFAERTCEYLSAQGLKVKVDHRDIEIGKIK
ncbi:MAG: RNase adapter RapZ [Oscillospiraceae bacterium]|nr:RNase adapter RapZ [Oscillospiraceae bacterium]